MRSSSSNTWNTPQSSTVSHRSSSAASSSTLPTTNRTSSPRSLAFACAFSIASGESSMPVASRPIDAAINACSPVPHPESSRRPRNSPASASARNAPCGRPMSHGGVPRYASLKLMWSLRAYRRRASCHSFYRRCHSFYRRQTRRSDGIRAGQTCLTGSRVAASLHLGPRRPNRSKQGTEQGCSRKATRSTCEYGWESELPVLAGYLGDPKAKVPRGNQAGRGVAWDHFHLLIPVRAPHGCTIGTEMEIGPGS